MNSIVKKLAFFLALIVVCFACCSCGASVDCIYLHDAYGINYQYNIRISKSLVNELENSSPNGEYTVAYYLQTLSSLLGADYYGKQTDGADEIYIVTRTIDDEVADDSSDEKTDYTVEKGFLQNRYAYKSDNPFNGLRAEYDSPTASGSLMDILKNGIT